MADTTGATPQPAEVTPPAASGEKKSGNLTGAQLAQRFMRNEVKAQEVAQAAEQTTNNEPTPAAETVEPVPAEVPAKPETESAETDEVLSPEQSLDPKLQEKINRRIGKEVAKRKQLEATVNELRAQVLESSRPQTQPTPAPIVSPGGTALSHVDSIDGLVKLQAEAKEASRWAERMLAREDIGNGVQVGDKILTKLDLHEIVFNARETLEDKIPARAQFLTSRNQAQQAAFERYPFLRDRTAPEYLMAQQAIAANPWLNDKPNRDELIGRHIMGLKYEQLLAEQAAKKTGAPAKPAAPKPAGDQTASSSDASPVRAPIGSQNSQQLKALNDKLGAKKGVTAKDYASVLAQRELLKNR